MIETPERSDEQQSARKDKKKQAEAGTTQFEVMGFKLPLKDDAVMLSGKPTKVKEANLISKYGGQETYNKVMETMTKARFSWEGNLYDFNERAFKMYERFRPSVPKGGKGWGRKGELNIAEVEGVTQSEWKTFRDHHRPG